MKPRRALPVQHDDHVFACSESIAGLCAALTGSDATTSFASTDVGVCIVAPETNFGAADVAAPALLAVMSTMLLLRRASARLALPAASCAAFAGSSMNDTDSLRSRDVTPFRRRVRVVDKMGSVGGAPTLGGKTAASSLAML